MRNITATILLLSLAACGDPDADADATGGKVATAIEDGAPVEPSGSTPATVEPSGSAPARVAAGSGRSLDVRRTPQGGYVMGSPKAPVKLVEYGSRTCPACARFSAEAMTPLMRDHVASGRVSYEFRDMIIHGGPDIAAALVGRCGPVGTFFPVLEATYAAQSRSLQLLESTPAAEQKALTGMPVQKALAAMARRGGYVDIAAAHGVKADAAAACLADEGATRALIGITEAAKEVDATPTFIVNGRKLDAHDWRGVESALKAAGA